MFYWDKIDYAVNSCIIKWIICVSKADLKMCKLLSMSDYFQCKIVRYNEGKRAKTTLCQIS